MRDGFYFFTDISNILVFVLSALIIIIVDLYKFANKRILWFLELSDYTFTFMFHPLARLDRLPGSIEYPCFANVIYVLLGLDLFRWFQYIIFKILRQFVTICVFGRGFIHSIFKVISKSLLMPAFYSCAFLSGSATSSWRSEPLSAQGNILAFVIELGHCLHYIQWKKFGPPYLGYVLYV